MSRDPIIAIEYGGVEKFEDTKAVMYALRDLFSQTGQHMMTSETQKNFIAEYDFTNKPVFRRAYHNKFPAKLHARFVGDFTEDFDLSSVWCHDIAYFAFIVHTKKGWVSNFLSGKLASDGTGISAHNQGIASYCLKEIFHDDAAAMEGVVGWMLSEGEEIHNYDDVELVTRAAVDRELYSHLNKLHPAPKVIAALHNDENAPAHFHRIMWSQ